MNAIDTILARVRNVPRVTVRHDIGSKPVFSHSPEAIRAAIVAEFTEDLLHAIKYSRYVLVTGHRAELASEAVESMVAGVPSYDAMRAKALAAMVRGESCGAELFLQYLRAAVAYHAEWLADCVLDEARTVNFKDAP